MEGPLVEVFSEAIFKEWEKISKKIEVIPESRLD